MAAHVSLLTAPPCVRPGLWLMAPDCLWQRHRIQGIVA
ncbi:hypothetical protein ppKF707_0176 [Metapseudomonas furukawaii]|uniref:Uncharacterized protein n=1 Tax=Metapseudomonas furukawaii TaxID=1149133 RepID=A0AAD1FHD8_METFU|nr:hypothetical protein ppKF707_0176 [Pseudomonas furukawaii]BAU76541.1 hypothetical protein KF707C_48530 [Pseudomonas furukawaii]